MASVPALPPAPPPDLAALLKALVVNSVNSRESKRAYLRGVDEFLKWCDTHKPTGLTKATVQAYRSHLVESGLAPSTVNLRMTTIRRLAMEMADNRLLAPDIASAIARVKGARRQGTRIGNWLTVPLAEALLNEPDTQTLKGKRDRAVLAVMLGCGLRRDETASLTLEHIQQRDGRWVIVDLVGKGARVRSVPMPSWAKAAIDIWVRDAMIAAEHLFRPVNKGDRVAGERPRYHVHFTPTSSSWLNQIERWFAEITRKRIRRGTFRSVPELVGAIKDYVRHYNRCPQPFHWVASASQIIRKVNKYKDTLETGD